MSYPINQPDVFLRPGQLQKGDVVIDPEWGRSVLVDQVAPVMIPYWNLMVPVYWIKGLDTLSASKVQTVCLPRSPWRVVRRAPVPDPDEGWTTDQA